MTTMPATVSSLGHSANAALCTPCLKKGHRCYASHVENGESLCVYCLDQEPCFYEQRNKTSPAKEPPMQTQTAKPNGHAPAIAARICKCGCGETVPTENRFSFINGHRTKKPSRRTAKAKAKELCGCGRELPHGGRCEFRRNAAAKGTSAISAAPPVAARVALEVTEAQLNQFLVRLSLEDKQRLANHFLQTAEV